MVLEKSKKILGASNSIFGKRGVWTRQHQKPENYCSSHFQMFKQAAGPNTLYTFIFCCSSRPFTLSICKALNAVWLTKGQENELSWTICIFFPFGSSDRTCSESFASTCTLGIPVLGTARGQPLRRGRILYRQRPT